LRGSIYDKVVRIIMRIITVKIPEAYLRELDELVRLGAYPSRSEVIRVALRELLKRELYDQAERGDAQIAQKIARAQSRYPPKHRGYAYDH
jgi:Arc/MetJ-type ribon-helix-helix transcriptional regulator